MSIINLSLFNSPVSLFSASGSWHSNNDAFAAKSELIMSQERISQQLTLAL
ncbi:hypothetical protein PULV_a2009 [Pseudoalteromonas ulvae UL12]|nr:hypothetical protein [Pseudoalteromonas ulvae UL12]